MPPYMPALRIPAQLSQLFQIKDADDHPQHGPSCWGLSDNDSQTNSSNTTTNNDSSNKRLALEDHDYDHDNDQYYSSSEYDGPYNDYFHDPSSSSPTSSSHLSDTTEPFTQSSPQLPSVGSLSATASQRLSTLNNILKTVVSSGSRTTSEYAGASFSSADDSEGSDASDNSDDDSDLENIGKFLPLYRRLSAMANGDSACPKPSSSKLFILSSPPSESSANSTGTSLVPNANPTQPTASSSSTSHPQPDNSQNRDPDDEEFADDEESDKWPALQRYMKHFNESWNAMRTASVGDTVTTLKTVHNMCLEEVLSANSSHASTSNMTQGPTGGEPSGITRAIQPTVCPPVSPVSVPVTARLLRSLDALFGAARDASPETNTQGHDSNIPQQKNGPETTTTSTGKRASRKHRRGHRHRTHSHGHSCVHGHAQQPTSVAQPFDEDALRRQIREIQKLNLPDKERDRRIQKLMTANYYRATLSSGHSDDDGDEDDDDYEEEDDDEIDGEEQSSTLIVTPADRLPTYCPGSDEDVLGCEHYQRGCKVECSTCKKWYTCRLCHDAAEPSHTLVRPETRHMLCMHCGVAQNAAQDCAHCGETMARYFCHKCKLWDDECGKAIYHCDDCGLCRIGEGLGKDFFHCKTCNVCMSITLQDQHRCIEHSTECGCPICGDYMFTSTETVVFMLCGHSIHQKCYQQHTKTSYKCPTCSRSVVNMAAQFRILDNEIENQPMPPPYSTWRSIIVCNDCQAKSNVPFHFLGLKCANCGSYNTSQHKLLKPEGDETEEEDHEIIEISQQREASESASFAFPTYRDGSTTNINTYSEESEEQEEENTCDDFFHDVDEGLCPETNDDDDDDSAFCELIPRVGLLHFN